MDVRASRVPQTPSPGPRLRRRRTKISSYGRGGSPQSPRATRSGGRSRRPGSRRGDRRRQGGAPDGRPGAARWRRRRSLSDVVEVCYMLGQACASSRHDLRHASRRRSPAGSARPAPAHGTRAYRQRSARASSCCWRPPPPRASRRRRAHQASAAWSMTEQPDFRLSRDASVISYGEQADGVVTTARRSPEAAPRPTRCWWRSTRTTTASTRTARLGHARHARHLQRRLQARRRPARSGPGPAGALRAHPSRRRMVPVAHLFWSGAWAGIAAGAVERARLFMRKCRAQRRTASCRPAPRTSTRAMRVAAHAAGAWSRSTLARFEAINGRSGRAGVVLEFQTAINLLKVECLRARDRDRDERAAGVRPLRLSQRRRVQHRPPSARRAVVTDHDQQRPHPRQPRHRPRLVLPSRGASRSDLRRDARGMQPVS